MLIPQTNTVIEFEFAENLLLVIGGALKDFQNKNNAKVQFLNVPQNIPPDAPIDPSRGKWLRLGQFPCFLRGCNKS